MTRWFNTAGPCFDDEHYMVPVERRGADAQALIEQGRWFVLTSGRQTGKTTVVQHLAHELTARGEQLVLWVDLETARGLTDPAAALRQVLLELDRVCARDAPEVARPPAEDFERRLRAPGDALLGYLSELSGACPRPLVLLFDEADTLSGPAMVAFLTQLRALYLARRRQPAPRSVALIGVRAVRDYPTSDVDVPWLGSASPFNVTVETVTLPAFSRDEIEDLLTQHTVETGQPFERQAVSEIARLSAGHPWLVNALADQATRREAPNRSVPIDVAHVDAAREALVTERRTHIDLLLARLREPRVRRVLDPMIAGTTTADDVLDDDFAYVAGLGLIRFEDGRWQVANPIYREVIPRALTALRQAQIDLETAWYLTKDGRLDVAELMAAWQAFWRKDGHLAAEGFAYRESGPHLLLMAFLQRVVNGGGRIEREYALGRGALDLLVTWGEQRVPIEVKLRRHTETEAEAFGQILRYLDALGLDEGWLVLFDLRSSAPWATRLSLRTETVDGRRIHVVGC